MDTPTSYEDFGSYRLTHLLGKGGMASVYRAVRSGPMGFAKEVAIKRIHDALVDNEAILKGLINEARIGGQLKHPNIVEVYEFNKVGDAYYLAMEFVDGWTLDKVIKVAAEYRMPVPPTVALQIGREICDGLEYAHNLESLDGIAVKLVHRDLKPANVILSRYGTTKIMDFGIAKAETNLFKTSIADMTKGTPHYMSPEQVAGASDLSATSDLFALGALLYEVIVGKVLFVGDTLPTVLFNVVKAEVGPQIAEAEARVPGIGLLLERLLKKEPDDRTQTAAEVGVALGQLLATEFTEGPTIREYLYSLRDRMMLRAGRFAGVASGESTVSDDTVNLNHAEPEFATLLDPVQREEPDANQGLVEARRAADAAIRAVGTGFESTVSLTVDSGSETLIGPDPGLESTSEPLSDREARSGAEVATQTNPNHKRTRKVPKTVAKKKRSLALPLAVLFVGVLLLLTWTSLPTDSILGGAIPAAERADSSPDPVDLSFPAIEFPQEVDPATPPAARETDPRRPERSPPARNPESTASLGSTTPASSEVRASDSPSRRPPAAPEPRGGGEPVASTPQPASAPAPTAATTGRGRVSIKYSKPYYARVWIDGMDTGKSTPVMGYEVPAGEHSIELKADEHGRSSSLRTVRVTGDGHVKLGHYDFETDSWEE